MEFEPAERERFRLRSGDLVVAEASGSPEKVGKPAIWNDELPLCCFQNTVIRLQPRLLESSYVLLLLRHCYFNRIFAGISAGVGINHLGARRLAEVAVPLAPEPERRVMIAEVERQFKSMSASRETIDSNLARSADLQVAILKQAFQGELIEPQPADEPAKALLERISARLALDRAAKPPSEKRISTMRPSLTHRPLLEVLGEHPEGMTPKALFSAANYTRADLDGFYSELARISDRVSEDKPKGAVARAWPYGAKVVLRLKGA
jgi:type I restriction enzyme S subunit